MELFRASFSLSWEMAGFCGVGWLVGFWFLVFFCHFWKILFILIGLGFFSTYISDKMLQKSCVWYFLNKIFLGFISVVSFHLQDSSQLEFKKKRQSLSKLGKKQINLRTPDYFDLETYFLCIVFEILMFQHLSGLDSFSKLSLFFVRWKGYSTQL